MSNSELLLRACGTFRERYGSTRNASLQTAVENNGSFYEEIDDGDEFVESNAARATNARKRFVRDDSNKMEDRERGCAS